MNSTVYYDYTRGKAAGAFDKMGRQVYTDTDHLLSTHAYENVLRVLSTNDSDRHRYRSAFATIV
jgi:hypothetical protein